MTRASLSWLAAVALLSACDSRGASTKPSAAAAESVPLSPPPPGTLLGAKVLPPADAPPAFTAVGALPGARPAMPQGAPPVAESAAPTTPGAARTVPLLQQVGTGCVPYAAAAVAQFHGAAVDPLALLRSVPVTRSGVAYADVAAELGRRGLRAEVIHPSIAELRRLLTDGFPIVVGQAWSAVSDHALVAIRHDDARGVYAIMDPSQPVLRELPAKTLEAAYESTGRHALWIRPALPR